MSPLRQRTDCQTRENAPRLPAFTVPEHGVCRGSFLLDYRNRGCLPKVKQHIIDMSLNASRVLDTVWVLCNSTYNVLIKLKKREVALRSVNTALLRTINPDDIAVHMERAGEAEMDEMWSFVDKKKEQRWLWHAIDHGTGAVLAYVFGRRTDEVLLRLKALLEPFGITRYDTDHWARTHVIWLLKSTIWASATRGKSSASI